MNLKKNNTENSNNGFSYENSFEQQQNNYPNEIQGLFERLGID